uniref:Family with sequence similarity 174 member B n=1 Tax=Bos taurus TaxID=9913 RepID=A0AAA9TDM3_BOVIN
MRAALPPARLLPLLLLLALLGAPAARASRAQSAAPPQPGAERQPRPPPGPGPGNATGTGSGEAAGGGGSSNSSGDALVTRISSLLRDLPTLKAAVIVACAFTAFLIACLLLRVFSEICSWNPSGAWQVVNVDTKFRFKVWEETEEDPQV